MTGVLGLATAAAILLINRRKPYSPLGPPRAAVNGDLCSLDSALAVVGLFGGQVRASVLILAWPVDLGQLDRWMRIGWERRRGADVPYGRGFSGT
jgi:hypothetical protein